MKRTVWFSRKFELINDNGLLPGIIERLEGTPARLNEKSKNIDQLAEPLNPDGKWSIKKEIGHLIDLEPLWMTRFYQILEGKKDLIEADLENTKTHQSNHDQRSLNELVSSFTTQRLQMIRLLWGLREKDLLNEAKHPRLGTPMKIVDLAYFVAEHDDHHLAQITILQMGMSSKMQ